jgi:hypothetical protein
MNSRSITDYILKLEKENFDLKKDLLESEIQRVSMKLMSLEPRLSISRSFLRRPTKRRSMPSTSLMISSTRIGPTPKRLLAFYISL